MSNFFSGYLAKGSGSGTFVEINYPGYSRQPVTFGPIANGQTGNVDQVAFTASAPWLPVTQDALFDASGNAFLWWNTALPVTLGAGQRLTIASGALKLYFDALALSPSASLQYATGAAVGIKPGGLAVTALAAVQVSNGALSIPSTNLVSPANFPTSLPATAGIVWNNGGSLQIS